MPEDPTMPEAEAAAAPAEVAASPAPTHDATIERMHRTARRLAFALAAISVLAFMAGRGIVERHAELHLLLGVALIGMAGSGVGALTSLLARYANGFEFDDGTRFPAAAEGEVYYRRIAFCMLMRPVLGALVAPLVVVGVALFTKQHEEYKGSADVITVIAFIGGLYAKSAVDAAKTAFKVVFRA
jgi:hypothetical protein